MIEINIMQNPIFFILQINIINVYLIIIQTLYFHNVYTSFKQILTMFHCELKKHSQCLFNNLRTLTNS